MNIYFVTGSEGKAREAAAIVPHVKRIDLDLPEVQSLDVEEVLTAKLEVAHQQEPGKIIVVEDTTYSIAGLNGLPGTLIKWIEQSVGAEGIYDMAKDKDCTTVAASNMGLVYPDGRMIFVRGQVKGKTVAPVAGEGFGFDSIFAPDGYEGKRYSELGQKVKDQMSHRRRAWDLLKQELDKA